MYYEGYLTREYGPDGYEVGDMEVMQPLFRSRAYVYDSDLSAKQKAVKAKAEAKKLHREAKIARMKSRVKQVVDYFKIPDWPRKAAFIVPVGFSRSAYVVGAHADQVRSEKDLAILEWVRISTDKYASGRSISVIHDEVHLFCDCSIKGKKVLGMRISVDYSSPDNMSKFGYGYFMHVNYQGTDISGFKIREQEYENLRSMAVQNQ